MKSPNLPILTHPTRLQVHDCPWASSCVITCVNPNSLTPKDFRHPGEFDGMDRKRGELRQMLERSRMMYADAYETIQKARQVQQKPSEQSTH